jgi:hypothetical protein
MARIFSCITRRLYKRIYFLLILTGQDNWTIFVGFPEGWGGGMGERKRNNRKTERNHYYRDSLTRLRRPVDGLIGLI